MKVLHVITSLTTGGAEKLMVDLLPRLRDRGIEVELAIFDGKETPFYQALKAQGIVIHRFTHSGGCVYNPARLWRLWRLVHKGHYDIVHTHNTAAQLFAAVASLAAPGMLVTTEHNTTNRRRSLPWLKPVDRWMYGRYRKVICISQKAKDNLDAYMSIADKSCTINNGIDISQFAGQTKAPSLNGDVLIVMVAAFRPQKDQETLLRAMSLLPERFRLRLVGDGVRRQPLMALAEGLGIAQRVDFAGVRSDVADQLRQADIVVMSSHFEGLSLSSVEGMASGRPFVASDVDGLREVVSGAGILFQQGDHNALARAVRDLATDPLYYRSVAQACQARATQYDISKMLDGYIHIYDLLLHN